MKTIRQQLTRALLSGFALLLGAGGVGVYLSTRAALLQQFDETLRAKANAISSGTELHGKHIGIEISEDFMREYDENVPVEFFQLWRADGTTVRRSKSLAAADLPLRSGTFRRPKFWNLTLPSNYRGRAIGYAFLPRVGREGEAASPEPVELSIVVASDRRELDETLAVLAVVLLACGALLLTATGLIVPRVLKRGLAPLNQVAEQTARIDADSLSTRFSIDSLPGELKPIGERLNNLLSRLEQSFERERQFSADLAHELRTPIAELRSLADVALKWPESRSEETDRDTLAIAIQMEGIVVRLLELLRSERGQLIPKRESILLSSLIENVWQPFAEKASVKHLKVTRNLPDDTKIESDPVLLRSIITNFVENAVEYTPRHGAIRIDAGIGGGRFTLRISNTVENLGAADLPKFFDRLWRKDSARSGGNHSGLGLSLARAFSLALGYELTVALDGESLLLLTFSGPVDLAIIDSASKPAAVWPVLDGTPRNSKSRE